MKLVFIGPQGSGKGTQAQILSEKLKIPHISTGDLLRAAKGKLKEEIDSYMLKGKLLPDEITLKVIKERLSKKDCKNGFILDGFPRNMKQAEMLDEITDIDEVVGIDISDKEAVKRISGRISCEECGTGFNTLFVPPKKKGICDRCGGKLRKRHDDNPPAIKKRLAIYHKETKPLLKHYKTIMIDGEKGIKEVNRAILKELNLD